ncbi:MAG: hypothetical protein JRH15_20335 [Deltaproteobacteria bacterium]|nr:hypothetical protein [Deltaproteobacteria bacterium]
MHFSVSVFIVLNALSMPLCHGTILFGNFNGYANQLTGLDPHYFTSSNFLEIFFRIIANKGAAGHHILGLAQESEPLALFSIVTPATALLRDGIPVSLRAGAVSREAF